MDVPTFYFTENDLQANGNISETAVRRECQSFENIITSKLLSELKYLDASGEPIAVRVGDKDLFKVAFVDHNQEEKA